MPTPLEKVALALPLAQPSQAPARARTLPDSTQPWLRQITKTKLARGTAKSEMQPLNLPRRNKSPPGQSFAPTTSPSAQLRRHTRSPQRSGLPSPSSPARQGRRHPHCPPEETAGAASGGAIMPGRPAADRDKCQAAKWDNNNVSTQQHTKSSLWENSGHNLLALLTPASHAAAASLGRRRRAARHRRHQVVSHG